MPKIMPSSWLIAELNESWGSGERLFDSATRIRSKASRKNLICSESNDDVDKTIEETLLEDAIQKMQLGYNLSKTQLIDIGRFSKINTKKLRKHALIYAFDRLQQEEPEMKPDT